MTLSCSILLKIYQVQFSALLLGKYDPKCSVTRTSDSGLGCDLVGGTHILLLRAPAKSACHDGTRVGLSFMSHSP